MREEIVSYQDFEFEEFDPVVARLEDPELSIQRFTFDNMKWETGRNEVRFFPKRKNHPLFVQVAEHWITTADGKRARFACPQAHTGDPCPICEKMLELQYAGMAEQAKELTAQAKYYALVIDMKRPSFGLQVAQIPWSVYKDLNGTKEDPDSSMSAMYGDYASSQNGYPVYVIRSEQKGKVSYSAMPNLKAQGPFDLSLLGGKPVPDIASDKLVFKPYEEVAAAVAHYAPARAARQARVTARPQPRSLPNSDQ